MKFKETTLKLIYNLKSPVILRSVFDLLTRSTKKFARFKFDIYNELQEQYAPLTIDLVGGVF